MLKLSASVNCRQRANATSRPLLFLRALLPYAHRGREPATLDCWYTRNLPTAVNSQPAGLDTRLDFSGLRGTSGCPERFTRHALHGRHLHQVQCASSQVWHSSENSYDADGTPRPTRILKFEGKDP